jgi:hypothetical protein
MEEGKYVADTRGAFKEGIYRVGGYWWLFFLDPADTLVYATSKDGASWKVKPIADRIRGFAVTHENRGGKDYFHFAYIRLLSPYPPTWSYLTYQRGTVVGDELELETPFNITDLTPVPISPWILTLTIGVDADGCPWIGVNEQIRGAVYILHLLKSASPGAWRTDWHRRWENVDTWATAKPLPLADSMYVYVVLRANVSKGYVWKGGWVSEEDNPSPFTTCGERWTAVAYGREVHLLYEYNESPPIGTFYLVYRKRSAEGVWGSLERIAESTYWDLSPNICISPEKVYAFYTRGNPAKRELDSEHIFMRVRQGEGWTPEQIVWTHQPPPERRIRRFGHAVTPTPVEGKIGFYWVESKVGVEVNDKLKFGVMPVAVPPAPPVKWLPIAIGGLSPIIFGLAVIGYTELTKKR